MAIAQTLAEYDEMQLGPDTPDWHLSVMLKLNSIDERLGQENKDGVGATGIYGRVMRTEADVKALLFERNFLRGAAALFVSMATFLAYVLANLKSWISSVPPNGTH